MILIGKIRKIVGLSFIIFGIVLVGITVWMKYDTYKQQKAIMDSFISLGEVDNTIDELEQNISENNDEKENIYSTTGLAIIEVPKLDLRIGMVEGVKIENIKYVAGHFPGTPMPGEEGNFCFAGHRVSYFGQPFKDADKLVQGDEFIVTYKNNKYIYEVTESFEVMPEDTYVLDNTPNESTMTLVTCTIGAKKRLIVKGKLKV